jgi:hypothetical protein
MSERVTDDEKLHLVMQVADEVARKHRIADPCELWGEAWLGMKQAESLWDGARPFLPFARTRVWGAIMDSFGRRPGFLTGNPAENA